MQEDVMEPEVPFSGIEIGRESEDVRLLGRLFNGLANSTRLSILLLLAQRGEMKVGDLVSELGVPQPRVSDHLRCLSRCGHVQVRRRGRNAYYSVADERVVEILNLGEALLRGERGHVEVSGGPKRRL